MPTRNRALLRRSFAALSVVLLASLFILAPGLRATPPTRAAGACPADRSHLMPVAGGRWYLSGVNVPWQNGGFGADFATVEEWNQHTYSSAETDRLFGELKAAGVNSVRWWIFGDGRGAPEFDSASGGAVIGFDATTLPGVADVARLAEQHGLYIVFQLFTWEMLSGDSTPSGKGEHAGGHRDLIVDPARRRSYIDNAVLPMLRYPVPGGPHTIGTHPNILGWEIINEPEWAISEAGAVDSSVPQPVSLSDMQRFVAEVSGAIHRNSSQLTTVGSAAIKWNSDVARGAFGNYWKDAALTPYDPQGHLDFYQVHYYGWMNGDATWSYSPLRVDWAAAGFDKPTVIGEYPANGLDTGVSLDELHAGMFTSCYGGAWAWTYGGVDQFGSWRDVGGALARFNAANASAVRIGDAPSEDVPAPTPAPVTSTVIYDEALAPGWSSWSWDTSVDFDAVYTAHSGTAAALIVYTRPWGGFYLHNDTVVPTRGSGHLRFALHGGDGGGQVLKLSVGDGSGWRGPEVSLPVPQVRTWAEVAIPLEQLGSPAAIGELIIQDASGTPSSAFFIDKVELVP